MHKKIKFISISGFVGFMFLLVWLVYMSVQLDSNDFSVEPGLLSGTLLTYSLVAILVSWLYSLNHALRGKHFSWFFLVLIIWPTLILYLIKVPDYAANKSLKSDAASGAA